MCTYIDSQNVHKQKREYDRICTCKKVYRDYEKPRMTEFVPAETMTERAYLIPGPSGECTYLFFILRLVISSPQFHCKPFKPSLRKIEKETPSLTDWDNRYKYQWLNKNRNPSSHLLANLTLYLSQIRLHSKSLRTEAPRLIFWRTLLFTCCKSDFIPNHWARTAKYG